MNDHSSWQKASPRSPGSVPRRRASAIAPDIWGALGERLLAVVIGGCAGLLGYLGWVFCFPRRGVIEVWSLTGPGLWWVLAGALLGLMGGLSLARALLDHVIDDARQEASITIVMGALVILVVGCALLLLWADMG